MVLPSKKKSLTYKKPLTHSTSLKHFTSAQPFAVSGLGFVTPAGKWQRGKCLCYFLV